MSLFGNNRRHFCLTTPVTGNAGANTTTVIAVPTHAAKNTEANVFEAEYAMIQLAVTGLTGSTGKVTAKFVVRGQGEQAFSTATDSDLDTEVTMNGATTVYGFKKVDVRALQAIKLYSLVNADATHAGTAQVEVTFKC